MPVSDVECDIDLYDHDIHAIGLVLARLNQARGSHRDLEGFRREIVDRFADAGLVATVMMYQGQDGGQPYYLPSISIVGRVGTDPFDHDRQGHEVCANLLDLPGQEATTPPVAVSRPTDLR